MKHCPVCDRKYDDEMRLCGFDGTPLEPVRQEGSSGDRYVGRTIKGRYQIIKKLGEGGMGAVYLAEQISMARRVAIKVLQGNYASDDEFIGRFRREARLAASLNHPYIVTVHDFDQGEDGLLFIAMEYVDGQPLTNIIRRDGPLDIGRAVRLGVQIAEGLEAAHRTGVIHRDIKPDNIMVVGEEDVEKVKLMDFGIARLRDTGSMSRLTRAGVIMGTPAYMAPEQAEGAEVSERTDVYALGIVLYEMLSGSVPFRASTPGAVLVKQIREAPLELRKLRREVPSAVERVVMQALEKEPEKRQRDMREIAQGLKKVGQAESDRDPPATIAAANATMIDDSPRTIAATQIFQNESPDKIIGVNRKHLGLGFIGALVIAGLVFGLIKFTDWSAPDEAKIEPPVVAEPMREPVPVPVPPPPSRPEPEPESVKSASPPPRPPREKPKPVDKSLNTANIQERPLEKKNEPEQRPADETKLTTVPTTEQKSPSNTKIQDHIRVAKNLRERGEYADASKELLKARAIDPSNKEVEAEMERTKKACDAERAILGRTDLKC
jgi:serine/threonine protein kinase